MATLAAVNETLQATNDNVITGDSMVVQAVDRLNNTMSGMVKMMQLQNLKLLEALREKGPAQAAPAAKDAGPAKPDSNIGMILAGIAAFTIGFLQGLADSFRKIFALTKFDKVLARIGKTIDAFTDFLRARFTGLLNATKQGPLAKLVAGVRTNFTEIFDFLKNSVFGKIVTGIKNILVFPFEGLFAAAGDANILTRIFNTITRPFNLIMDGIKSAVTIVDNFMPILKTIGGVLGRLFFPFTVIMTIFDTVKEAIAGFEEGGILGGLAGAITGLLNSIVGMPLDLLKSAVSFILEKMGFENASEALDSFSFQDIIKKVIFSFVGFLRGVVNGMIEGIATLVENLPLVPDSVGDKIRSLKFKEPEGGPSTESDAPVDMEAPEQQAISGGFMDESFGGEPTAAPVATPENDDRPMTRLERKLARQDVKRQNLDRQAMGQQPVVNMIDQSSKGGDSVQTSPVLANMASPFDNQDPMFSRRAVG
tara:strand:+ start:3051 stop:4490 length:1440 start_codon:yes stop_codon:yes gene_type:complete